MSSYNYNDVIRYTLFTFFAVQVPSRVWRESAGVDPYESHPNETKRTAMQWFIPLQTYMLMLICLKKLLYFEMPILLKCGDERIITLLFKIQCFNNHINLYTVYRFQHHLNYVSCYKTQISSCFLYTLRYLHRQMK